MKSLYSAIVVLGALQAVAAIPTNTPIYLAEIFHPPTMNLLAFLPGETPCLHATQISEDSPFSIGGTDGLVLKNYWEGPAEILKDGKVFAECAIGPDAIRVSACPVGQRKKFGGVITRRWSCWVKGRGRKSESMEEIREEDKGGSGTRAGPNVPYWEME